MTSKPDLHWPARFIVLSFVALAGGLVGNAQGIPYLFSNTSSCVSTQSPAVACDVAGDAAGAFDSPALYVLNKTYASTTPQAQVTVNNVTQASYGLLRAQAEDTFQIGSVPLYTHSFSLAEFQDFLTISDPPLTGQTGYLVLAYTFNGNVSATPANSDAEGLIACGIQAPGLTNQQGETLLNAGSVGGSSSAAISGMFSVPSLLQFTWGQPFGLYCLMIASAGSYNAAGEYTPASGQGSAIANFADTAVISGIEFTDASGNPVSVTPTITAASGTKYSSTGVLTPFKELSIGDLEAEGKELELEGSFILAAGAADFDPLTQDVAFQIGSFSRVIPAGSFQRTTTNQYDFNATLNGVRVHALINRQRENRFRFDFEIPSSAVTLTASRVKVMIEAGMSGGTTTASTRD